MAVHPGRRGGGGGGGGKGIKCCCCRCCECLNLGYLISHHGIIKLAEAVSTHTFRNNVRPEVETRSKKKHRGIFSFSIPFKYKF